MGGASYRRWGGLHLGGRAGGGGGSERETEIGIRAACRKCGWGGQAELLKCRGAKVYMMFSFTKV